MSTLYDQLHTMREEDPILWAVIRGASSIESIAKSLMWKPSEIIEDVQDHPDLYIDGGIVKIELNSKRYNELIKLSKFASILFSKIVEWGKKNRPTGTEDLTDKQAHLLTLLATLDMPFATLDAAKVQGYSKAGFTSNQLDTLERKGKVKAVPGTRPKLWTLV